MCGYKYKSSYREKDECKNKDFVCSLDDKKIYCIFHAPVELKDDGNFWSAFTYLIEEFKSDDDCDKWDFEGFVFPETVNNFWGYEFPEGVWINFRYATFMGKAYFYNAKFGDMADFRWATFKDEADFGGSTFKGVSFFYKATFECEAYFGGAIFKGEVYYINTQFLNNLSLYSANFHSQVNFKGAYLSKVDFAGATFRFPPYMGNMGAGSEKVTLEYLVVETTIEFNRGIVKIERQYNKDGELNDVKTIPADRPFEIVIEGGDYKGVFTISSPVNRIEIRNATFGGTVKITPKITNDKPSLDIDNVNFLGNISISDVYVEKITNSLIGESFVLRDSDLRETNFENTNDLRKIDFINIDDWHKHDRNWSCLSKSLKNLDGLYGEEIDSEENYRTLAEMYRAVASSYESRNRYGSAGPFKVGEYEMRKKMAKTSKIEKVVLWLYKTFSSYGESLLKPLFYLLIFTPLICSFLYLFSDIPYKLGVNKYQIYFDFWNYRPSIKITLQFIKDLFSLYFPTIRYIISMPGNILQESKFVSFILSFGRILTAVFLPLFLFALRRRVKR